MTNGLLIYGEIFAHLLIYWEALHHIWLCNCSTLNFLIYEENLIFFFISVRRAGHLLHLVLELSLSVTHYLQVPRTLGRFLPRSFHFLSRGLLDYFSLLLSAIKHAPNRATENDIINYCNIDKASVADPDPVLFVIHLQDANKKQIF